MFQKSQPTKTTVKTTNRQQIRLLTSTAIFAAMITVMTAYICHIPTGINGGYIHFGDGLIYLAAALLPAPYALAAGAIGGGMADLLTAPEWAIATIIIKMLITVPFTSKKDTIINVRNVLGTVLAFILSGLGYFIAEVIMFGTNGAAFFTAFISSFTGSFIQSFGSAVVFIIFGIFLDRIGFKKRFLA